MDDREEVHQEDIEVVVERGMRKDKVGVVIDMTEEKTEMVIGRGADGEI